MMPFPSFRTVCLPLIAAAAVACGGGGGGGAAPDTTAPTVTIHFPPPTSMTEGSTVTVRGTATDRSDITLLQINGMNVTDTSDDDSFATWSVDVTLAPGANTLTASVEDSAGNTDTDAASVSVFSDETGADFPNSDEPLDSPAGLALDSIGNVAYVTSDLQVNVISVDLATGVRTLLSPFIVGDSPLNVFGKDHGLHYDEDSDRLLLAGMGGIIQVDTESGARTVIASSAAAGTVVGRPVAMLGDPSSDDQLLFGQCNGIGRVNVITGEEELIFSTDSSVDEAPYGCLNGLLINGTNYVVAPGLISDAPTSVLSVDMTTGDRTVVSSNVYPNTDAPLFEEPYGLVHDVERGRYIVSDTTADLLIAVDEVSGVRSVLSGLAETNSMTEPNEMQYIEAIGVLYLVALEGLLAVDIQNGERVYVSKSYNPR